MNRFVVPQKDDRLTRLWQVRVFPGMDQIVKNIVRANPYRWQNESEFVRSAIMHYFQFLADQRTPIVPLKKQSRRKS